MEMGSSGAGNPMFGSNTLVTGGTFIQKHRVEVSRIDRKGGFERLHKAAAPGAFHDSGERFDPPRCHPNTRLAVLQRILDWAVGKDATREVGEAFVMWLYGPAGAGKSAIAQSIAELCQKAGILLASFFFSRTDPARNHPRALVASITYQTALRLPQAKDHIVKAVEQDPLIFTRSLEAQFDTLLFTPLQSSKICDVMEDSCLLIIIDGLDECENPQLRCSILHIISKAYAQHHLPMIRFLIASRPEQDIMSAVNSYSGTAARLNRLALDDTYHPDRDIRLFLQDKFRQIQDIHRHRISIPLEWPGESVIEILVNKSSGQFIYVSTVINYISSFRHGPDHRLEVVLGLRPVNRDTPFAELDALYSHIFSSVEELDIVLQILGLVILGLSTSINTLEDVLGLGPGDIRIFLADLSSLIYCEPTTMLEPSVRILHASLKDFLLDEVRSKNAYVNPALRHAEYVSLCCQYFMQVPRKKSEADDPYLATLHVFRSLIHHLNGASLTAQIHRDLRDFSFDRLFEIFDEQRWSYVGDLMKFWSNLIRSLLRRDDAKELHKLLLQRFDNFLKSHLDKYYSLTYLTYVIALLYRRTDLRATFFDRGSNLLSPPDNDESVREIDDHGLRILTIYRQDMGWHSCEQYFDMIREFYDDSLRCGSYALTGERYASAALCCLQILVRHEEEFLMRDIDANDLKAEPIHIAEEFLEKAVNAKSAALLGYIVEWNAFRFSNASPYWKFIPQEMRRLEMAVDRYIGSLSMMRLVKFIDSEGHWRVRLIAEEEASSDMQIKVARRTCPMRRRNDNSGKILQERE